MKVRFYMRFYTGRLLLAIGLIFLSCGKSSITIDKSTYEPKIVINGYLYPEKQVSKISVTRNFPLGETIDTDQLAIEDAVVTLTDLAIDSVYHLSFNSDSDWFEYAHGDLHIDYGSSYRIDVSAEIDGQQLSANSMTSVPDQGLEINNANSVFGDVYYRQKDINGELISPLVAYNQSANTAFYLLSITAIDTGLASFIYENPIGHDLEDMIERGAKIENFMYSAIWIRPEDAGDCGCSIETNWYQYWFYGRYRLILYAGDKNFYHYFATHGSVMGMDGNLHEPIFDIDGDGIGVFGSAITDTIYVNVLKP